MSQTTPPPHRKTKKSYTLSLESAAFLETIKKQRRAASVSAALEELLQSARREHQRAAIGQAVADYYSSLSDREFREQAQWGEFALREFRKTERR